MRFADHVTVGKMYPFAPAGTDGPGDTGSKSAAYIPLPRPIPVYLTYLTAVPIEGQVVEQKDIYGKDRLSLAS